MKILPAVSLLFLMLSNSSDSKEYIFNVNEGGREYKNIVNINKIKDGYHLKSIVTKEEENAVMEAKLNKDFETVEWKFKNPKKKIEVAALREGNKITVSGEFDGRENNKKEIYIDDRPWHQIFQLGLMKFAVTETREKTIEFWGLRPDNPESAGVLAATKEKVEIIEVKGGKIEAAKLRIGLAGWLSIFWTGDYWFRVSDGVYVKAKPAGNISAELIEEND
ncbi:MAG: hypothetical protein V1752_03845 [Candidatus Firestonebacteria bacterium]